MGFAATSAEFRIGIVFLFVLGGLNSVLAGKPWSGFGWFLYGVGFLLGFYLLGRWGMLGGLLVACLIATPNINLYEHEMAAARILIGFAGRAVFWLGFLFIVGHALWASYIAGNMGMVVVKVFFFPITYLVYPWYAGLWWILLSSIFGYWISTHIGKLRPVG